MNQVDSELWHSFTRRLDEDAFRPLYEQTARLVYTLCLRLLRNADDAGDAFQAAYARLLVVARDPALAREVDDVAAFVCLLARREADSLRKRRGRRVAREKPLEEASAMSHGQDSPERLAALREVRARIEALVEALPQTHRLPLQLHFFHGLSQREVARALGESTSTVADRIGAGLRKLEPACRRAGLGEAATALAGVAISAALFQPAVSAGEVFAHALAAGAGASAAAGVSTTAPLILTTTITGGLAVKTKILLAAALAVLCFALGGAYVLRHPPGSRLPPPPEPVAAAVPATIAPPAAPAAPPPAGAAAPNSAAPGDEKPAEAADIIAGFVRDIETGAPLAGAAVRAGEREAIADANGAYSLRDAGTGRLTVTASAPGYARRPAKIERPVLGETAIDFPLDPAATVRFVVTDEEGNRLPGARVVPPMFGSDGAYHLDDYVETDARGEVVLTDVSRLHPPSFQVGKEGFKSVYTEKPRLAAGGEETELRVVLPTIKVLQRAIVGRVSDREGRPIAAATIEWKDGEGTSFGSNAVYGQFKATSGKDGYYKLEYPDDYGQCSLGVAAKGWAPLVKEGVRPGTPEQPAEMNFTLEPAHWLGGTVVDEEGKAVAGASVTVMPRLHLADSAVAYPAVLRRAETNGEGKFSLEDLAGPKVGVELRGPPGGGLPGQTLESEVDREVKFVLRRLGVIRGRVADAESGEPVPAFTVKVTSGPIEVSRMNPGESFSSPGGKFVLKHLERGIQFAVLVEAEGYIPRELADLSPEAEASDRVHEVALSRGRVLEGVIVNAATGSPIAGAKIFAWKPEAERDLSWVEWDEFEELRSRKRVQRARTDESGAFRVLEDDPATLFIRAAGYQRFALPPEARARFGGAGGRLVIPLEAAAVLRGAVRRDGQPHAGAAVSLYHLPPAAGGAETGREFQGTVKADERGEFRWDDLRPGTYLVETLRITDTLANTGVRLRRRVEVKAGSEETVAMGDELGELAFRGRLLDRRGEPVFGPSLILRPEFPWSYEEIVVDVPFSAHGRFHFPGLRPGRYGVRVETTAPRGPGRTVVLPAMDLAADLERDIEVDLDRGDG